MTKKHPQRPRPFANEGYLAGVAWSRQNLGIHKYLRAARAAASSYLVKRCFGSADDCARFREGVIRSQVLPKSVFDKLDKVVKEAEASALAREAVQGVRKDNVRTLPDRTVSDSPSRPSKELKSA